MRFKRCTSAIISSPVFLKPLVSSLKSFLSGSPANRTQRDPVISRIQATSLRLPIQSGTSESNREPPAPKAGVLPSAPVPDQSVTRVGVEPNLLGLKDR